jgi:hypothetical protein
LKAYAGKVKLAWRDLPLATHPDALIAAEAAREALSQKGNEGFWKMETILYANQPNLNLDAPAREVGLDVDKLKKALDAHVHRAALDADAKAAGEAGIVTTPTFVVGPYILSGAPTLGRLRRLVERVLAETATETVRHPSGGPRPLGAPTASTVRFTIIDSVTGSGRAAKSGDTVTVHYRGRLLDGTEFDSSYRKHGPFTFTLGSGLVIQGWEQGLLGMRVGGRRKLTIPPELGYGNHGEGTSIPPNSVLIFDMELLSIK